MNFLFEIYKNPFKYLFFLLLILYILLYTSYGLEDGDMGAIFGISWSMYNGSFPYRDFVYIKPPFSPFFHSLPLYFSEEYAYIFNRGFYFVQVFGYSYLASRLLFKIIKHHRSAMVYFVAIVGAMISIHNYPPMPWNTIDGIFFSVIGLSFVLSKKSAWWKLMFGALFISMGVLCKQSFYFFPVMVTIKLFISKNFKTTLTFVLFGVFFACCFLGVLYFNGALQVFFDQMFSFTSSSSLLNTGFRSYYLSVKFNILYILASGLILFASYKWLPRQFSFTILLALIASVFIYLYYSYGGYYVKKYGLIQILWLAALFVALFKSRGDKRFLLAVLMLGLSWCASISNGFNTPIDFSIPIVFLAYMFYLGLTEERLKNWIGVGIVVMFAATFYYGYQFVYRDSVRSQLVYNMDEVFPRLKSIKSDKTTFEKYAELKALSTNYDNYTVLPSMTLGHYITNTVNPIGVDWVFNHHLSDQLEAYKQKLIDQDIVVFLENFEGHEDNYEESSLLTVYVKQNWRLIEQRDYFRVYRKP